MIMMEYLNQNSDTELILIRNTKEMSCALQSVELSRSVGDSIRALNCFIEE